MGLGDFLLGILEQGAGYESNRSRTEYLSDRADHYANSADKIHNFRENLKQRH